jgi:hypothetical protein
MKNYQSQNNARRGKENITAAKQSDVFYEKEF